MLLRCVGKGDTGGLYRLVAPRGLTVEPALILVEPLGEGQQRVVRFEVRAAMDAPNLLHGIRMIPEQGLRAAPQSLLVSIGVVMTSDNRIPNRGQFVVRAPGYTMKVDHYSGVSFYLLDADGHRRFTTASKTRRTCRLSPTASSFRICFIARGSCSRHRPRRRSNSGKPRSVFQFGLGRR